MILADAVPGCSSILAVCRVDGLVIGLFQLQGRLLLSSNSSNVMENNTCHDDVAGPLRSDPEVAQALETCFQQAYGRLHPGSGPAVGQVEALLGAGVGVRVRGQ